MKKIAKMMLAIVLCLGFLFMIGCNDNVLPDPDGGKKKVTLAVWIQNTNQPQFFNWAAAEYKKQNSHVTINYIPQSSATLGATLDATLKGSASPDISATWGGLIVPRLIAGKSILKLNEVITKEVEATLSPSALINKKDDKAHNEWYSAPVSGFASPIVFYNKTFFDANNISEPTTYQELKDLSAKIKTLSKEPMVAGFGDWPMSHFMQGMHGRTLTPTDMNNLIGINTTKNPYAKEDGSPIDGLENGWKLLKQYQEDGIFANNITGYNSSTAQSRFTQGMATMLAATSLEFLSLSSAPFEIGAFVLPEATEELKPAIKPESLVSGLTSDVFVISAKTKNPEEAKKFLSFLMSKPAQEKLFEYFLFPAIHTATTENMPTLVKTIFDEVLGDIYNEMKLHCTPFYQSYSIAQTDGRVANLSQNVLSGSLTPLNAAKDLVNFYKNSGILS